MLDDRFSASSFLKRGIDTDDARQLASLLADELQKELQKAIEPYLALIIKGLNDMGHNLKPEVIGPGEFSYRDDYTDDDGYHCRLRVALDLVVSTGYAHLNLVED